ncbi:phospholipase A1-like isoform X2 [Zeugodacus cucurbitae]|uniref:phospholipase A1-like isoform X2 n=1 Tax=Zeugodacus cucurbitae TaxID=28588 RepID=UPI0023D9491E|nr:phospholipase A1-like isoform X2 [Zeugodacus cucurbitae]
MMDINETRYVKTAVSAFPVEEGRENGENGWYIPQVDGSFVWMTIEEGERAIAEREKQEAMEGRLNLVPVNYYLYTQRNPTTPQKITVAAQTILNSNFNPSNPTKVLVHGWWGNYKAAMNNNIRDAWLSHGDYNIIVVDWARARSIDYVSSVVAVPKVGQKVADMIDCLVQNHGMSLDQTEVIGHSLGAQVAGFTGKKIVTGRLHAIVGLDPALPLYSYNKPNKRLNSDDAAYVESIQTDGGQLGFLKPIGKGAFYPNGGKKQPGCGLDLTGSCSHGRSCIYYAEAVRADNFPSMRCGGYQEAVNKSCGVSYSGVKMGAVTNAFMVAGDFYVPVRATAPYGFGSS